MTVTLHCKLCHASLLVAEGRGLVAFALRSGVAFSAGDPICAPADVRRAGRLRAGRRPILLPLV